MNNYFKNHKDVDKNLLKDNKKDFGRFIINVMMNMSQSENNPNYQKYMPKKFDKELYDNGDKNTQDSYFYSMSDNEHDTIARRAIKKFMKENNI